MCLGYGRDRTSKITKKVAVICSKKLCAEVGVIFDRVFYSTDKDPDNTIFLGGSSTWVKSFAVGLRRVYLINLRLCACVYNCGRQTHVLSILGTGAWSLRVVSRQKAVSLLWRNLNVETLVPKLISSQFWILTSQISAFWWQSMRCYLCEIRLEILIKEMCEL